MLEILRPLTAAALVVTAFNPCLARETGEMAAPGVGRFFPVSAQIDTRGFEETRVPGARALNAAQLNRVLWQSSFERGIAHGSEATIASAVSSVLRAGPYRAEGGQQRVNHGGMLVGFPTPFMNGGMSEGLARRPGIGAWMLAALAIVVLAISRRRTGYQPIVPPRPLLEAQAAANGAT